MAIFYGYLPLGKLRQAIQDAADLGLLDDEVIQVTLSTEGEPTAADPRRPTEGEYIALIYNDLDTLMVTQGEVFGFGKDEERIA